tara:strand:- start:5215 stop:6843 length:1629 start_codon:yes stop_codon:yes gene_type:complete
MALGVKVIFDLDNSKLLVEDNNDYSTSSLSGDLHVVVTITGPGGSLHSGGTSSSPDMTIPSTEYTPSSPVQANRKFNGTGISLPSTINGTYKIEYNIYDQAGSGSVYTETYAFDYSFSLPTASVGLSATMSASLLTSTDSTVYGGSYTNDSLTRTHSIHPPAGAVDPLGAAIPDPADTGSTATITYTGITTGTWSSTVSTFGEWSTGQMASGHQTSKHYVTGTVTGGATTTINSDLGLCDVYCCLKALNDRYEQAKCKNKDLAEEYKAKIEDVTRLVTLFVQAVSCGLTGDASCYLTDIKNISECGTECKCYGDSSVPANIPIVSTTNTKSYVLETSSNRLTLTSSGSGTSADPVVYRMDLGPQLASDINYVAENIQTTNSVISETTNQLQDVLQRINNNPGSAERMSMRLGHIYGGGGVRITKQQDFITGTRFYRADGDDISIISENSSESNWKSLNNSIKVSKLYDSTWKDTSFYIEAFVINVPELQVEVFDVNKKGENGYGSFLYRFADRKGYILTNNKLKEYGEIIVSFDLISGINKK